MNAPRSTINWNELLAGLSLGLIFGLALQKSGLTDHDVILRTLLLQDLTAAKVLLTTVVVGGVGVYALRSLGLVQLHLREASFGSNVIGGLIFGVGMALLGYLPGTVVGAVGEGRLDALVGGILGMLAGSFLFAQAYPSLQRVLSIGNLGDKTFWQVLRVNPWVVVVVVCGAVIALLFWLESVGL